MLNEMQVAKAMKYNTIQAGTLYDVDDLPEPLPSLGGEKFAQWVANFQMENGMTVDGKLGPKTLVAVRIQHVEGVEATREPDSVTKTEGVSNCIIIRGKRVRLPQDMLDAGFSATNYLDDGEPRFKFRARRRKVIHFVLHETCGNTADGCKGTLLRKGSGVQLIQDEDGNYSCHGDVVLDRMVHANHLNETSFGCEQVNPYSPLYVRDKTIWHNVLQKQWWTWVPSVKMKGVAALLKKKGWVSVPKQYVTLTARQVESMRMFAPWICEQADVPYQFPTVGLSRFKRQMTYPGAGVVAHRDFSTHSDGRYMLESLIKRDQK